MLQLASQTGATLAGNVYFFFQEQSQNPISPPVTHCFILFFRIVLFSDLGKFELATSVLTSAAKVRRPCKRRVGCCLLPILHPLVVPV